MEQNASSAQTAPSGTATPNHATPAPTPSSTTSTLKDVSAKSLANTSSTEDVDPAVLDKSTTPTPSNAKVAQSQLHSS